MSMLDIHSAALGSKLATYHEFLARYSRRSKVVYGFVEGKDDPCFYRGFIELLLPDEWEVELWPAGNKDQVYRVHSSIDWRRFPKTRICFFVDRDLSDVIPERLRTDRNIYVTTGYSIENDVVRKAVCKRLLVELYGFSGVDHGELEAVGSMFEEELEVFLRGLVPIMAWIVHWRRRGARPNLNDILMRDLFAFREGHIQANQTPKGKANVFIYIHEQCNITFDSTVDVASILAEVGRKSVYRTLTRGKFLFWFLVKFCESVHGSATSLFPSFVGVSKASVTLSPTGGMAVVGTRARIPASLRAFLESTFCAYISRMRSK